MSFNLTTERIIKELEESVFLRENFVNDVEPIFNSSGMTNECFKITTLNMVYLLKLSKKEKSINKFRKWYSVGDYLSEKYNAPKLYKWLSIKDTLYQGILMEYVEGEKLNISNTEHIQQVLEIAKRLNNDKILFDKLKSDINITSSVFFDSFLLNRIGNDYKILSNMQLEPAHKEMLPWLHKEIENIKYMVGSNEFFNVEALTVVHRDLNFDNIVIDNSSQIKIIDWDDLGIGDSIVDSLILLWPFYFDGNDDFYYYINNIEKRDSVRDLYIRSFLFENIIDSLVDYYDISVLKDYSLNPYIVEKKTIYQKAFNLYKKNYLVEL